MKNYVAGMLFGAGVWSLVVTFVVPTKTKIYMDGQQSIRKEAFDKGYMVKTIEGEKIVYKWIEKE